MTVDAVTRTTAEAVLLRSLVLLENGDARGWVDLFHDDGVLEFPYAPDGWPAIFHGRDALWRHMQKFPEHLTVSFSDVVFYETADPDFTVAEFHGNGSASTGLPFVQDYVSLVWTKDGLITRYRDFWNPLRHLAALGGADAAARIVQS
jgi:ketosteroid isomerase-like protein